MTLRRVILSLVAKSPKRDFLPVKGVFSYELTAHDSAVSHWYPSVRTTVSICLYKAGKLTMWQFRNVTVRGVTGSRLTAPENTNNKTHTCAQP